MIFANTVECFRANNANDSAGKNQTYEILFTSVQWGGPNSRTVELRQYPDGPTLNVECCEFVPNYRSQLYVLLQNSVWCSERDGRRLLQSSNFRFHSSSKHTTPALLLGYIPHAEPSNCETTSKIGPKGHLGSKLYIVLRRTGESPQNRARRGPVSAKPG